MYWVQKNVKLCTDASSYIVAIIILCKSKNQNRISFCLWVKLYVCYSIFLFFFLYCICMYFGFTLSAEERKRNKRRGRERERPLRLCLVTDVTVYWTTNYFLFLYTVWEYFSWTYTIPASFNRFSSRVTENLSFKKMFACHIRIVRAFGIQNDN